jgi:hypothetical protein
LEALLGNLFVLLRSVGVEQVFLHEYLVEVDLLAVLHVVTLGDLIIVLVLMKS